ncbi:hypothetical protein MBLNU457_g1029t2 [Dothideomycetes sp. NU457]
MTMDTEEASGGRSPEPDEQQPVQESKSCYKIRDKSREKKELLQNVSEEKIRELVRKAREADSLANLYPLGKVVRGALVFHHLSSSTFEKMKAVLETEPTHPIIKLDYLRQPPRARHGRLISEFADQVARQMLSSRLLPTSILSFNNLWGCRNNWVRLKHHGAERYVEAHGSLCLFRYDNEFLIVDCTFAKPSREIENKARDYLYGAKPPLNFAVFIHIDTCSTLNVPATASTAETQKGEPWHPDHTKLLSTDRVTVSVYQNVLITTKSGKLRRDMKTVVDNAEVWPTPATDKDFFTIKWSDMNWGLWEDLVTEKNLHPARSPFGAARCHVCRKSHETLPGY